MTWSDDLIQPLRAVSVLDPAIDRALTPTADYAERRDPELVRELPGKHALWCTLEPLSIGEFASVDSLPTAPTKLVQAFRLACSVVENAGGPGVAMRPTRSYTREDGVDRPMWSDRELALLFRRYGAAFIYELGGVAYERAVSGNVWGGSVRFTLPQSSIDGLRAIARSLAEQERESASDDSTGRPASERTPTPPSSSDEGSGASAPSGAAAPADGR